MPEPGDAVVAIADLVHRLGGKFFEIGYLHDNVPMLEAGWYATATYHGAKVIAEGETPWMAADGLAIKLLSGGRCSHCDKTVTVTGRSPKKCVWYRDGNRWDRGCGD